MIDLVGPGWVCTLWMETTSCIVNVIVRIFWFMEPQPRFLDSIQQRIYQSRYPLPFMDAKSLQELLGRTIITSADTQPTQWEDLCYLLPVRYAGLTHQLRKFLVYTAVLYTLWTINGIWMVPLNKYLFLPNLLHNRNQL